MYTGNKIFLFTVILCVAVLAAYRGYGLYSAKVAEYNEKNKMPMFASISSGPGEAESSVQTRLNAPAQSNGIDINSSAMPTETAQKSPSTYAYSQLPPPDGALPQITADANLQARAQAAFDKYLNNPLIKQFNADLQTAGVQDMDFSRLAGTDAENAFQQNPQLRDIFIKYSQNPRFIALIQQMGTDPEIQAVTREINKENYERQ